MTIAPAPTSTSETVSQPWIKTPLIYSAILSKLAGCKIYLKLENVQPSGSFKSRGVGNLVRQAILRAPPNTPLHFYCSSGGNAGLACVTAAVTLGHASSVIVPLSCKPMMIDKLRAAGATDVIQIGQTWFEADKHLREVVLANDPNGVYVPPFDHPDVWKGASSMIEEIDEQLEGDGKMDAIVCSVGGGGLLIGLCDGLANRPEDKKNKTQVVTVETLGAESLYQSVQAKSHITLPGITSLANSLGCVRVASRAFEYALQPHVHSTVVSDREAVEACIRFADDERILVEPACGATIALVYTGKLKEVLKYDEGDRVVLVVCGGSNISLEMLQGYKETFNL
ncbi:hypothetical protein CI109_103915 [Kwoniella shandongensis]|uniref:L-serine ammonia-lyase n=1 Tax=Kwoniella shandongensis TaxID=1734106 RepID=A0A5M6BX95_9TREE|nr:uncharacterized protein CI109_005631 [Kwoniella shandongensis]KAA5526035.1 hypothetical protein CI109_005631 [Kwoniella shandongensis]